MRLSEKEPCRLKLRATYACKERKNLATELAPGEGLVGQCAQEKQRILLTHAPPDYVHITSGFGQAPPLHLVVLPILVDGQVRAVIEQWVRAKNKAGLPEDLVLYCARHDFGTYVLQKTGDIAAVMNSMGHSDVKTAMTYQHSELNVVRDAINSRHILRHTAETAN